jgi:hypothetical protein
VLTFVGLAWYAIYRLRDWLNRNTK